MAIVKMPDGSRVKFPDSMSPEQIQSAIETDILPNMGSDHPISTGYQAAQPSFLDKAKQTLSRAIPFAPALMAARGVAQDPAGAAQEFVRGSVEALPTAGAMFGGAIGAAPGILTGPAAIPVMSAGGMGGAGLGMAGGESLKQIIQQSAPEYFGVQPQGAIEQFKDIGQAGITGAASEAAGGAIFKGVEKVLAPGAAGMTAEGKALFESAKKQDLPLSPDVFTKSKFTKSVVKIMDEIPPGNWSMAKKRADLATKLTQARHQFITDTLDMPGPGQVDALRKQTKELYSQVAVQAGDDAAYSMPNLLTWLQKNIDNPDIKASRQTYDNLTRAYSELKPTATVAVTDATTEAAPAWTEFLKGKMGPAMKEYGNHGDAIRALSAEYKQLKETGKAVVSETPKVSGKLPFTDINNLLARAWSGKYEKLTPAQINTFAALKNALDADVQLIEQQSGNTVYTALQLARKSAKSGAIAKNSDYIEGILRRATDYDTGREVYIFKPLKYKAELEKAMPRLQRMFSKDPEKIELLKKFSAQMEGASTDISRLSQFKAPGLLEKGAGAGAVFFQPWLAVPAGFDVFMAHSLMNPKGWMKQWLTEGVAAGAGTRLTKEAVKPLSYKVFNRKKDAERE